MTTVNKKKQGNKKSIQSTGSSHTPDLGNDPYFVKKAAKSRASLKKYGFPEELVPKK